MRLHKSWQSELAETRVEWSSDASNAVALVGQEALTEYTDW
jgi:hypothetical protein